MFIAFPDWSRCHPDREIKKVIEAESLIVKACNTHCIGLVVLELEKQLCYHRWDRVNYYNSVTVDEVKV